MPYKDPARQREYQRQWAARRRARHVDGATCVDCGATTGLELDHRDPSQKVSHKIWSWTTKRLAEELAKCEWRCQACHVARHREARPGHGIGGWVRGCRCEICGAAKRRSDRRATRHPLREAA